MADALQLIAENKRTKVKFLDLGNCGLTKVPDEVGDLAWLESLSGSNQRLTDFRRWPACRTMRCSTCVGTKVTDLAPLAGLSGLQMLCCLNTQISDLAPLAGLSALETWMSRRRRSPTWRRWPACPPCRRYMSEDRVSDLAPLAGLSVLQTLFASDTQVSDLTPLAGLSALQTLNVHNTQVSDLAPLAGLSALQTLNVYDTQVSDLSPLIALIRRGCPVKWVEVRGDKGIYVEGCPLTNPPPEIVKQGNEAILNYFAERAWAGSIICTKPRC